MAALHRALREAQTEIGHVKIVVQAGDEQRTANLTNVNDQLLVPDHTPLRGTAATLILNARVQAAAEFLDSTAREIIAGVAGPAIRATTTEFRCLTPGRPQPTYRHPVAATPQ
jgi:hypothetical protein